MPKLDQATGYALAVKTGKVMAGRPVKLACARHLRDRREQKARGLVWRADLAQRAVEFFATILILEDGSEFVLHPYQAFIVGSCFGWYTKAGTRRFRDAYVESGKGSGKTPLAAGIGLYGLLADGESAPEVYAAATMREQAKICFKDAVRMVEASPELKAAIEVQVGSLTIPRLDATFRPVSSEHRGLDGLRVHVGIIDELHEHPTGMVVDKIRAGTKRRKNALVFRITNSGFDRTSVCWHEHDYSIRVLEGTVQNDSWFAYVCALDEGDDWRDRKVWPKANPGLSAGLPPVSYLREQVASAVGMPSKENLVRRLNFCEWTETADRWLDIESWGACGTQVDLKAASERPMWAGLDAGTTNNIAALVLLFGPDAMGAFDIVPQFWIPQAALAAQGGSSERDRLLMQEWVTAGLVKVTSGDVLDYDLMQEDILTALKPYQFKELAFNRYEKTQLVTHLQEALGEDRVIDFPQSYLGLSAPCKTLEKLIAERKLRHGGNPVLRAMASNIATAFGPDGQIRPDRARSGGRVEGIIALVMAVGRATITPAEQGSIYEDTGQRPGGLVTL